jgi:hypothetical protein
MIKLEIEQVEVDLLGKFCHKLYGTGIDLFAVFRIAGSEKMDKN